MLHSLRLLLPLLLLPVAIATADTTYTPPCPLDRAMDLLAESEGDVDTYRARYPGRFLEAWDLYDVGRGQFASANSNRHLLMVLSMTRRGRKYTPSWKTTIHATLFEIGHGERERAVRLAEYTIVPEYSDDMTEVTYIEDSFMMADADSNGHPEFYLAIAVSDGGEHYCCNTSALISGERREYFSCCDTVMADIYPAGHQRSARRETIVMERDRIAQFARCHNRRMHEAIYIRNRALPH